MNEIEFGKLQSENARLISDLAEARKEAAKYRTDRSGKVKAAEGQVAELQAELEKLRKENAKALKQIEEMPRQVAEENARLKGEIRTGKYRAKFDEVAKEMKADPRALDALWKLSEVDTTADEIDGEALKGAVSRTLETNPYMRAVQAQPAQVIQPGPGGGQGGKAEAPGTFSYTYEQGRDPAFMRANRDRIAEAAKAGTLRVSEAPSSFRS